MNDTERRQALADFLRTRRARLSPPDVGLPWGSRRRTPGLRREEVAQLANIGTSWYVSLEQGRDVRPSEQVLDSLAQALLLNAAERRHLYVLALPSESASPAPLIEEEQISEVLRKAVDALSPHPAYVLGRRFDLLTWNRAAELVFAFSDIEPPHTRNFVWRSFTSPMLRNHPRWRQLAQSVVAQLRAESARYPGDAEFAELIGDLQRVSAEFRQWWAQHDVKSQPDGDKHMEHPTLGRLDFYHVTLQVPSQPDLKLTLYTGTPETLEKLAASLFMNRGGSSK